MEELGGRGDIAPTYLLMKKLRNEYKFYIR
jgi:hypothetical protein